MSGCFPYHILSNRAKTKTLLCNFFPDLHSKINDAKIHKNLKRELEIELALQTWCVYSLNLSQYAPKRTGSESSCRLNGRFSKSDEIFLRNLIKENRLTRSLALVSDFYVFS